MVLMDIRLFMEANLPRSIEPQWSLATQFTLLDPMNVKWFFPLNIYPTYESFAEFLPSIFLNRMGKWFVDNGDYELGGENDTAALRPSTWREKVITGSTVVMSIVLRKYSQDSRQCPRCDYLCLHATLGDEVTCSSCQTVFRVSEAFIQDIHVEGSTGGGKPSAEHATAAYERPTSPADDGVSLAPRRDPPPAEITQHQDLDFRCFSRFHVFLDNKPLYATPQAAPPPFLPSASFTSSLYLEPITASGFVSDMPETLNANTVLWPEAQYESQYITASWVPLPRRQRTNSWHGPAPPPTSPFLTPAAPAFIHSQSVHSWNDAVVTPWPSWLNNNNPYLNAVPPIQIPLHIHPWLNGDAPSPVFHFDLAPGDFAPLRLVSANPPQSAFLGAAEFSEPAFHPPLTALRIFHPRLPFWPVDLYLPADFPADAAPPPISLADVLVALHRALHQRISRADWATLSPADEAAVARAFAHRCRAEAVRSGVPPANLRDREVAERNEGVKRVDFLLGKTVFKGLVRAPEDPEGCVRIVTA
ncbi:hypothetical protein DFH09DRAFT_514749 [Mycena vulgaris]|nr:hypothetical protein DFH09DRAFT_514749 [Mycena vulgaris]